MTGVETFNNKGNRDCFVYKGMSTFYTGFSFFRNVQTDRFTFDIPLRSVNTCGLQRTHELIQHITKYNLQFGIQI